MDELTKITDLFNIPGKLISIELYGSGHIHKTYLSSWEKDGVTQRYIHQCINDKIFTDVEGLMQNIKTVLSHIAKKTGDNKDYRKMELIASKEGKTFAQDSNKNYWRTYSFLENTRYLEVCETTKQAEEAGRITGYFQNILSDLDVKKLKENIRKFTSGPHRLAEFKSCIGKDKERTAAAAKEILFAEKNADISDLIESKIKSGKIPVRVVHGDTKINNVLFDSQTDKAVCLVDLDTSMPGYSLYDFGDLVRSTSINVAEDEQDFSKIVFNQAYFEAIFKGYFLHAKTFLNDEEKNLIATVPQLIAFTLGLRFLTDYLNNDVYFKIKRPLQNLERARTQFKIYETFKNSESKMQEIIKANAS